MGIHSIQWLRNTQLKIIAFRCPYTKLLYCSTVHLYSAITRRPNHHHPLILNGFVIASIMLYELAAMPILQSVPTVPLRTMVITVVLFKSSA